MTIFFFFDTTYFLNPINSLLCLGTIPRHHFTAKSLYNEVLLVLSSSLLDDLQDKSIIKLTLEECLRYSKSLNVSEEQSTDGLRASIL